MNNLEANISLPPAKVKGRYKLTVRKPNGDIRLETDWFDNLITNYGLDSLVYTNSNSFAYYCRIGSGDTTPSFTDTALVNQYASTSTIQSRSYSYVAGPPAHISHTVVYRFAAIETGVTRTIREIGVSNNPSDSLQSRALILDTSGNPITITMIEGEVLDATYQYDYYFALMTNDYTQTITIDSVEYTVTWRAALTDSNSYTPFGIATLSGNGRIVPSGNMLYLYSGTIGAVSTLPSGTNSGYITTTAASTYVTGSYQRTLTWDVSLNEGNFAGGIGAAAFHNSSYSVAATLRHQCSFSPTITKTENDIMKISVTYSVARY